jgi:hypothetical protein
MGSAIFLCESLGRRQFKTRKATPAGHHGRQCFAENLILTSWKNLALLCASKAGLVNNLNDGLAWGPFASPGLSLSRISFPRRLYPSGIGASRPGGLSDCTASG